MDKHIQYRILKDYGEGKIDKYEALENLDLDHISELMALVIKYTPESIIKSNTHQSDETLPTIAELWSND
jgi:hypothetical protein